MPKRKKNVKNTINKSIKNNINYNINNSISQENENNTRKKRKSSIKAVRDIEKEKEEISKYKSIKNRFESFSSWSKTFATAFTTDFLFDLAIQGFYCINNQTKCIYCGMEKSKWDVNDTPSAVHSECLFYNLTNKHVRRKYNKWHDFECSKCKGIALELKEDFKVVLCGTCGGISFDIFDDNILLDDNNNNNILDDNNNNILDDNNSNILNNSINDNNNSNILNDNNSNILNDNNNILLNNSINDNNSNILNNDNNLYNLLSSNKINNMFKHKCCVKCAGTRKLKFTNDLSKGEYNTNILRCITEEYELPENKIDYIAYILNSNNYNNINSNLNSNINSNTNEYIFCAFDNFINAAEIKLEKLSKEVEKDMIKIDEKYNLNKTEE